MKKKEYGEEMEKAPSQSRDFSDWGDLILNLNSEKK